MSNESTKPVEDVPHSDEHPDDVELDDVELDDDTEEEHDDAEPDFENGTDDLPEGAPDPGDDPVLDDNEDSAIPEAYRNNWGES